MAQSSTTVTPPSPTPPTNMSFTGATPPNVPNYTKLTYADPKNWGTGTPTNPPPFFDDGAAGSLVAFASNTAALASGSGATAGGTEGTYPGAAAGAVPASSSVAHEGAGTEVVVTASVSNPSPNGQLQMVSDLGSYTRTPNADHASSLSPSATLATTTFSPTTQASGGGTFALTVNGTGFTRQSVVYINGIAQTTNYVSSTQLTCPTALKRPTAGTYPLYVLTAGVVQSPTVNYTYT